MLKSSNGNIFRVTGPLCGEFTGPVEFPTQRPVTRSFDVFFDLRLNKPLSKQSWGWWFETLSRSLWRHRNVKLPVSWCLTSVPRLFVIQHIQVKKKENIPATHYWPFVLINLVPDTLGDVRILFAFSVIFRHCGTLKYDLTPYVAKIWRAMLLT